MSSTTTALNLPDLGQTSDSVNWSIRRLEIPGSHEIVLSSEEKNKTAHPEMQHLWNEHTKAPFIWMVLNPHCSFRKKLVVGRTSHSANAWSVQHSCRHPWHSRPGFKGDPCFWLVVQCTVLTTVDTHSPHLTFSSASHSKVMHTH